MENKHSYFKLKTMTNTDHFLGYNKKFMIESSNIDFIGYILLQLLSQSQKLETKNWNVKGNVQLIKLKNVLHNTHMKKEIKTK